MEKSPCQMTKTRKRGQGSEAVEWALNRGANVGNRILFWFVVNITFFVEVQEMAGRSLWRVTTKLLVATTALGGGAAAATIASSDDPAMSLKLCTIVPLRLCRDSVTAATIAFGTLIQS
ncbi:putative ABC1 protein [Capsicum baccatum]|uniref:ABC1 protein n=1 Tax=Capsicum baccatum TaxID=33114 RepID=A0A2G2WI23_CAPBA|nr:putative ABC1 protein [Capsicum baccatum]